MQSSKTSKPNSKKIANSAAATEETKPAAETKKTVRATRASESKKTAAEPVSAAAKSHRRSGSTNSGAAPETATAKSATASKKPAHEEIAVLAYSYWVQRGYEHGYAEHDWHRAIQQLSRS